MKTNPKQTANGRSGATSRRAPLVRGRAGQPGGAATSVKNRIGKPAAKPTGDLRQMLAKKVVKATVSKAPEKPNSDVKSRLGLQSKTARLEALREAKEQLKAVRDKNVSFGLASIVYFENVYTVHIVCILENRAPIASLRLIDQVSFRPHRNPNQNRKQRRYLLETKAPKRR